jgi:hypothetical protein
MPGSVKKPRTIYSTQKLVSELAPDGVLSRNRRIGTGFVLFEIPEIFDFRFNQIIVDPGIRRILFRPQNGAGNDVSQLDQQIFLGIHKSEASEFMLRNIEALPEIAYRRLLVILAGITIKSHVSIIKVGNLIQCLVNHVIVKARAVFMQFIITHQRFVRAYGMNTEIGISYTEEQVGSADDFLALLQMIIKVIKK